MFWLFGKRSEQLICCRYKRVKYMCMSLQCTLCKRGQPEDRPIPVQVWTLIHCILAYLSLYVCALVCFLLLLCLHLSLLFIMLSICIYVILFIYVIMFCVNAVIRRLFNPLRRGVVDIHVLLPSFSAFVCVVYFVPVCQAFGQQKFMLNPQPANPGCRDNTIRSVIIYM